MQSFFGGLAASGALTTGLRLMTKAAFENSGNGLRKGTSMFTSYNQSFELLISSLFDLNLFFNLKNLFCFDLSV